MALLVPTELTAKIDELVTHYPETNARAAALWLLHLLQDHFGYLGSEHIEWIAKRLSVRTIDIFELVTFYPMFTQSLRGTFHIKVCRTLSCHLAGADQVIEGIKQRLSVELDQTTADGLFTVSTVECLADCGSAPVMMVNDEHFRNVTPQQAVGLVDSLTQTKRLEPQKLPELKAAHAVEKRVLLANLNKPAYSGSLAEYKAQGGYEALRRAMDMTPDAVAEEVNASKLRGRGGAGFPTGMKWKFADKKSGKPIYLICNADESEPGTFKDRVLLHHEPHQLLEGILIACYALSAKTTYIYIRGEFPHAVTVLSNAIAEAKADGLLGDGILGKDFSCNIYLHRGAGAYICGEETGLIESLEGKRPYPRIKPPFPALYGVFGCPTVVNNVETLSNIPHIIKQGSAWFAGLGVQGSAGTRIVCVSGKVKRPGYYEIELGKLTMRQLIDDVCGGLLEGRTLKGVIPGGSSMPVLLPDQLDVSLDFDAIQKAGSYFGSGGVIVLDDTCDVIDTTLNLAQFYAHESCGQCTPCREGTQWMEKTLHRMHVGKGRASDVDVLYDIADNIDGKTICALGEAAAWPVKAFVTKFKAEFQAEVASRAARGAAETENVP